MASINRRAKKNRDIKKIAHKQGAVQIARDETIIANNSFSEEKPTGQLPVVVKIEEKKRYLLDALLIVFSVLLALMLNELRTYWLEKRQTRQLMSNVKAEISKNKSIITYQHEYHQRILSNIDSALTHTEFKDKIFLADNFNISLLAPEGIVTGGFLDQTAWNVAKSNNISTKIDFALVSRITYIYDQQQMVLNGFDLLKNLYSDRLSQRRTNADETLKLMRKIYTSYITARSPDLLRSYDKATQALKTQFDF